MIFLEMLKEQLQHIENKLNLLNNAGMIIKLKKSSFISETFDYLARIIVSSRLHDAARTTKAIRTLQFPTIVSELQSFL